MMVLFEERRIGMEEKVDKQAGRSRSERKKMGKALRQEVSLSSHGQWTPAADRPDPLSLLQAQDQGRLERLLPIKYGRMLVSPFTFYRGSAVVMVADLAGTPVTGIEAVLCGDAHLSNFGIFATPERRMVFDVNDFDEAFPGPWEWDLKRLAASAVIAGRDNGFSEQSCRQLAEDTTLAYGQAMDRFSQMPTLEQWYYHVNVEAVQEVFKQSSKKGRKSAATMVKKAGRHTHEQTLEKLTRIEDGQRRIIGDPPLLMPIRDIELEKYLGREHVKKLSEQGVEKSWREYLASLPDERRYLLQRYEIIDIALRVGGIGSVGTRCAIVLLKGGAEDDSLILQLKEAGPSVLEAFVNRKVPYDSHAQRVVTAQRVMQATSDIFLGWSKGAHTDLDYYWRQLKDMKGSADVATMDENGLKAYLAVCSWCLARAHARTGDGIKIRGYLGQNGGFARAIGDFAVAYADQTERDYAALVKAVKSGRIAAETGI
jgi:uncharacterized protein (DUF2252 family)